MTKMISERQKHASGSGAKLTRRAALLSVGVASLATVTLFKKAHRIETAQLPREYKFRNDDDQTDLTHYPGLHEGKGAVDIKFFFRSDGAPKPALLLLYT